MFGILVRCEVGCLCNYGDRIVGRFHCCRWGEGLGLCMNYAQSLPSRLGVWRMSLYRQPTRRMLVLKSHVNITLCVGWFLGRILIWSLSIR